MPRRQWKWNELQSHRVKQVKQVIDDLQKYWPLTIRQIHYQLFARQVNWGGRRKSENYPNTRSGQGDLIQVAKFARLDGMIPWNAIEDRTRSVYRPYKHEDIQSYLENELYYFLEDYKRCLIQDQDVYVEVWVEKDALFKIFKNVCQKYCIPVIACRGYDSITYLHNFYEKAKKALNQRRKPIVLYFGDLDPSGVQMLDASIETLEEEMGLSGAAFKRMAIKPEQVIQYNLPNDPTTGKITDTRFKGYVEKYGYVFVELDALHPHQLEVMIKKAIENEFDMDAFHEQQEVEEMDHDQINDIKIRIVNVINEELGTDFSM